MTRRRMRIVTHEPTTSPPDIDSSYRGGVPADWWVYLADNVPDHPYSSFSLGLTPRGNHSFVTEQQFAILPNNLAVRGQIKTHDRVRPLRIEYELIMPKVIVDELRRGHYEISYIYDREPHVDKAFTISTRQIDMKLYSLPVLTRKPPWSPSTHKPTVVWTG